MQPKLAAIYNVFDGIELLQGSILTIQSHVDEIIILWQDVSNYGEKWKPHGIELFEMLHDATLVKFDPILEIGGSMNERAKRNLGLDVARDLGCTHFISMDVDEYYDHFGTAKEMYFNSGHAGSVCMLYTYFKHPTLRHEYADDYFVPFIHELKPDTKTGSSSYPFRVDPTRAINTFDVIELPIVMHHYSWVRKDIQRKARNSSAKANIMRSNLMYEYENAVEGMLVDGGKKLIKVPDMFGIEEMLK